MDFLDNLMLLPVGEVESRFREIVDLWSLIRIKDFQLVQISRSKWLKKINYNSVYLHAFVKSISRRNTILALKVRDVCIEGVPHIRQKVVIYFFEFFRETYLDRHRMDDCYSFWIDCIRQNNIWIKCVLDNIWNKMFQHVFSI